MQVIMNQNNRYYHLKALTKASAVDDASKDLFAAQKIHMHNFTELCRAEKHIRVKNREFSDVYSHYRVAFEVSHIRVNELHCKYQKALKQYQQALKQLQ